MNLDLALEIVQNHIRIGKGMELTNGLPEALEMVVEELAITRRALELACLRLCHQIPEYAEELQKNYLSQAKDGEK